MAVKGAQVTIAGGGNRSPLNVLDTDDKAGQSIAITYCANDLYLGDSTVTNAGGSAGALVPAGTAITVDLDPREVLYAWCAAATTVHVLHQGS